MIAIRRSPRMAYAAGGFKVLIDGVVVGKVKVGDTVEFPVTPGTHTVQMAVSFNRSKALPVDLSDGQRCELVTKPHWFPLFQLLTPRSYLRLIPMDHQPAV
jgi:hypothetical protein